MFQGPEIINSNVFKFAAIFNELLRDVGLVPVGVDHDGVKVVPGNPLFDRTEKLELILN